MLARKLVILLDADDCFYNFRVRKILLHIAANYGDILRDPVRRQDSIEDIEAAIANINLADDKILLSAIQALMPDFNQANSEHRKHLNAIAAETRVALDALQPACVNMILCLANDALTQHIVNKIKSEHYEKVIFMVGSNRQSHALDQTNSSNNGTRSFYHDLDMYCAELNLLLQSQDMTATCEVDKFLMADIFADRQPGYAYELSQSVNASNEQHPGTVFDVTKFSLIYAFMHYLAKKYKTEYAANMLTLEFFEDLKEKIILNLENFITENPDLLPANLPFDMYHYEGGLLNAQNKIRVCGSGAVAVDVTTHIKKMVELCDVEWQSKDDLQQRIDVMEELDVDKFRVCISRLPSSQNLPLLSISIEPGQQEANKTAQQNDSQTSSTQLADLPFDIWREINGYLLGKNTARVALSTKGCHRLFQSEIGKKEAEEAAECAIYPTKENVEKLRALLEACPVLLSQIVTVKNRHGMVIRGTVLQIAKHEGDNELIDNVIKPGSTKLHNGLVMLAEQDKAWLPDGWLDAEEKAFANALAAIDKVFAAFQLASNPNDVTESPEYPHTITINNNNARTALEAARIAIDALYQSRDKVITSGRDPSIRLLEHVIDQCIKNHNALGGDYSPRNHALMRFLYGYCQRFAPINFMQAFAQGILFIVFDGEPLIRSLKYSHWPGHSILPLDSNPQYRLGNEYFVGGCMPLDNSCADSPEVEKTFYESKRAALQTHNYAVTCPIC